MKQYPISIYYNLSVLTKDKRKLAIAYIHSLLNPNNIMYNSKSILPDEGMHIYKQLGNISRDNFKKFEEDYLDDIKIILKKDGYNPKEGGVEKDVVDMIDKYGFEDTIEIVGNSLEKLLTQKPNLNRPIKKITAGRIQKYEQQAIKKELLQYLK